MLISYVLGQTSIILRVKIPDTSKTDNSGVTGITSTTTGLSISTIADNEASATVYTSAASHVQTITTLGTFAAPSASNCRFKEVDSTNHPGIYEIQLDNSRYNVSSSKSLLITIKSISASNVAQVDVLIPLVQLNPYSNSVKLTSDGVDAIVAETGYNLRQAIALILDALCAKINGLPSSPGTIRDVNDTTNRIVIAFDSNNNRTSITLTPPT